LEVRLDSGSTFSSLHTFAARCLQLAPPLAAMDLHNLSARRPARLVARWIIRRYVHAVTLTVTLASDAARCRVL